MPIYEYQCEGCQQVFEVRQKISDPPPESHGCGSQQIKRILSATTFVLKGTGWYKTDYADKKPPAESSQRQEGEPKASAEPSANKSAPTETTSRSSDASTSKATTPAPSASSRPAGHPPGAASKKAE